MTEPLRVLLVKTSSLGDVIHTLPAISDAVREIPGIRFDWVVEEGFAEIPHWHPAVDKVIPCALRRWRRNPWKAWRSGEWPRFKAEVHAAQYDLAIDAQGLIKSAFLVRLAQCPKAGPDRASAREGLSSYAYDQKIPVARDLHAVQRLRQLFARALVYPEPQTEPEYGVDLDRVQRAGNMEPYVLFLHGTTWATKHWPEACWIELGRLAIEAGYRVRLPWGNHAEHERAVRIAEALGRQAEVLSRLSLRGIAGVLSRASAIVAVDTGLCHLAAAMDVPTVSLYGPTDPYRTGAVGHNQLHLSASLECAPCLSRSCNYMGPEQRVTLNGRSEALRPPCFAAHAPDTVWQHVEALMAQSSNMADTNVGAEA